MKDKSEEVFQNLLSELNNQNLNTHKLYYISKNNSKETQNQPNK